MAALGVKRTWWMRQRVDPDAPLFRVLARRWTPVVRIESQPVPMRFAHPAADPAPLNRGSLAKMKPPPAAPARSDKAWSPWFWVK